MDGHCTRQKNDLVVKSNLLATYTYQGIEVQLSRSGLLTFEVEHFFVHLYLDASKDSMITVQDINFDEANEEAFTRYETEADITSATTRETSSLLNRRAHVARIGLNVRTYVQSIRKAQQS